ncbi:MAG: 23S rRNA (adenine(2030)-N(6))-methyltransferase RlmJ [Coxiella sp. RIFCSPHIGHO2_12_FULL_44_14]|nr:MAG: 23S rRNA (adenine(2030)-N(6))-methyltransferase RlmJ [Coxiella sp. RIFCSPHIGHO2_12_FULL_44_14]
MLSYQHIYHAGSCADVYKHAALAILLTQLTTKARPLTYFETHAGRGVYNLSRPESQKTQAEPQNITQLMFADKIPHDHPYYHVIRKTQSLYGASYYPGSPEIARLLLRPYDQLHLMELHPQEYAALKKNMRAPNIHIHRRNGYEGVMALSPPPIRRGLVLIDPPYEVKTEYQQVATFIITLHHRWPQAVILLWYPILKEKYHLPLKRKLQKAQLPAFWQQEVLFAQRDWNGLLGCGLICVHLPFHTKKYLKINI